MTEGTSCLDIKKEQKDWKARLLKSLCWKGFKNWILTTKLNWHWWPLLVTKKHNEKNVLAECAVPGKKSQKLTASCIDLWEIVKNLNENNVKWQAYYLSRGKWNENQMFQCCINIKWNGEVNDYSLYLINVDRQSNNLTQKKKNTASETFRKNFLK